MRIKSVLSLVLFLGLAASQISACAPVGAYEVLSPTRIRRGDATLDVAADLSAEELLVHVRYTFPSGPGKTRLEGDMSQPLKSLTARLDGKPLALEPAGGGGGGGAPDESSSERNQIVAYRISPALETGQDVRLYLEITFDETIGIPDAVPFEYDLRVKEALGLLPAP